MIEENGGVNLYRFLNNKFMRFDFLGLDDKCSAIGNFNVLSIMISINPAEREFDQRSVINAANDLLERLKKIGFYLLYICRCIYIYCILFLLYQKSPFCPRRLSFFYII